MFLEVTRIFACWRIAMPPVGLRNVTSRNMLASMEEEKKPHDFVGNMGLADNRSSRDGFEMIDAKMSELESLSVSKN